MLQTFRDVKIKHNKMFSTGSLFSKGYCWPDMGERWFNSEPATFKIVGRKSHCIMCFKGESGGELLRSGRLEVSDTVLTSHRWWWVASVFFLPPPKAMNDLFVFPFLSEVPLCLPTMYYIYWNIWIKDKSQKKKKKGFGQFENSWYTFMNIRWTG